MDLKELTLLRGVSGNEQAVRRALMAACRPLCDDVALDKIGNVVARKRGRETGYPHVLLAAHMDEVGFIVMSVTDDGLLRIRPVGGIDPRVVISKRVLVGDQAVPGVIGAMAIHLQTAEDRRRVLQYDGIYVDIGAKTKEEAAKDCPPGSYVTFDTPYTPYGEGFVCAKALDDRVGCLNLLKVLEGTYPGDVTCLFTAQEEVGCRGAMGGAFGITPAPEVGLILEGTACNDLGDVPDPQKVCRAGEGVAVSFMDNASLACRPLYLKLLEVARERSIPHQIKQSVSGGNDSRAVQRTKAGIMTCVLSVPCRYIHSPSSAVCLQDVQAQLQLVQAFLKDPRL